MEDFSFPTTTADSSSFASIDSPPLWHLSPAGKQNVVLLKHDQLHDDDDDLFQTSGADGGSRKAGREEEDEKMDFLWEDLNDDLLTTTAGSNYGSSSRGFYSDDGGDVAEMGCFQALSFPRGNAAAVFAVTPTERPTFVVFMKFLRRLFLVHSSPPPPLPLLKRPRKRRLP